jgi:hypothetical protein
MPDILDRPKQQIPQRELPKAREEMERAYANSGVEINPIVEIAKLGKMVNAAPDTFAIKKEDRTRYLNLLSVEEKKELINKINEAISSQNLEENSDNMIRALDEQIEEHDLFSEGKDFTYSLLNSQVQELIRKIQTLDGKDNTAKNLQEIVLTALENNDSEKLNLLDSNLVKTHASELYPLYKDAQRLSKEITEPLNRTKEQLKSYFELNLTDLELTFDQALEASANNVNIIYDFLSLYANDPLTIDSLEKGQKADIIRLAIDQLKEEPYASEDRKKQIFTASIKLGLSALEAEKNRANN